MFFRIILLWLFGVTRPVHTSNSVIHYASAGTCVGSARSAEKALREDPAEAAQWQKMADLWLDGVIDGPDG